MAGFTQEYFAPFLLFLGGAARHIGMLSALPNFFASLIQLKSADITEKAGSRKKIVTTFVFLQAMTLLLMVALALIADLGPVYFIIIIVFFVGFGALAVPAWGSLMSDLVPEGKRGKYFGWRYRTLGFVVVAATFFAGFILQVGKKFDHLLYGFIFIFGLAFIFRFISWLYLLKMHEPKLEYKKEHYFSFISFLRQLRKSNFARFVLFVSLMNFSVNLASPFFAVLMLKEMNMSYFLYAVITVTAALTGYLTISQWGNHADKTGNLKVIRMTSPLIGLIPFFWILNQAPLFLICAQVFSGFVWAGFNISTTNFIYDAVSPVKRTRCIAYFNVFNGAALSAGALIGGFLLYKLPALFAYKTLTIFLISGLLRLTIGFYLPRGLKEVRPVEKIKSWKLFFSVIGWRPILGMERKTIRY